MRGGVAVAVLCLAWSASASEPVPDQAIVFYNARMALRENQPTEALRLWLLRNGLKNQGEAGTNDADFRSVVWAALGKRGLCPDGFPKDDEGGAGLWPLALHNWLVAALGRGPAPDQQPPFDVFETGLQQRFISLNDVLSNEELRSATFFPTSCATPFLYWFRQGHRSLIDLDDRLAVGTAMRALLEESRATLVQAKVRNTAVIEARLFDLDLALAELQGQKTRREARMAALEASDRGVSKPAAEELRQRAEAWPKDSREAAFLRRSLTWTPREWMSLNPARRLNLFAQAAPLADDPKAAAALALGIVDELVDRRMGGEVESFLGFLEQLGAASNREAVTSGARGERLLALEPATGFRGRATVALHRGVAFLEEGRRLEALRSFAFALRFSEEATDAEPVRSLARRWLTYVLARYETDDEVLAILAALVPRQEYNPIVESLLFRAAFHADRTSFQRLAAGVARGGSFELRVARLRPLAEGRAGDLLTTLRDGLEEEPYGVLNFVKLLLDQLETEDADVRRSNAALLERIRELLLPLADGGANKGHARRAEALLLRMQAILDGLARLDESMGGQARAQSPDHETFAGHIRLAPADPLPWPFRAPQTSAPSVFQPLVLEPVEWRDVKGALVFGWRLSE